MESAENRKQPIQINQPHQESPDSPSLSKVETLKLLNDSIDKLEATIKGISENSAVDLPSSASINDLVVTAQELAATVTPEAIPSDNFTTEPSIKAASVKIPPASSPAKTESPQVDVTQPQPKLNKTVLISLGAFAIALVVIALVWLWYPQYQASRGFVAPPPAEIATDDMPIPESISTPESQPVDLDENSSATEVNSALETPTEISIPQDLTAPGRAKNLKIVTIEPELTFTPEQNFVAALQTKIANLTEDERTDFIDLIEVNLTKNSVLVKVNDNWYELNESSQNKIGNAILERSRQLKFEQLRFQDATGTLVARNPVVGNNIIIVETEKENS